MAVTMTGPSEKEKLIAKWTGGICGWNQAILKFEEDYSKKGEGYIPNMGVPYEIYSSVELKEESEIQKIDLVFHGFHASKGNRQPFNMMLIITFKRGDEARYYADEKPSYEDEGPSYFQFCQNFLHFAQPSGGANEIAINLSLHPKERLQSIYFQLIEKYRIPKEVIDELWVSEALYRRYSLEEREFYMDPIGNKRISSHDVVLNPTPGPGPAPSPAPGPAPAPVSSISSERKVASEFLDKKSGLESKRVQESTEVKALIEKARVFDQNYLKNWCDVHSFLGMKPPAPLTAEERASLFAASGLPEEPGVVIHSPPYFLTLSEAMFSLAEAYFQKGAFNEALEVLKEINDKDAMFPQAQLMKAKIEFSECSMALDAKGMEERKNLMIKLQSIEHPETEILTGRLTEIQYGYTMSEIKKRMETWERSRVNKDLDAAQSRGEEGLFVILRELDKEFKGVRGPLKFTQSMLLQMHELFPTRKYVATTVSKRVPLVRAVVHVGRSTMQEINRIVGAIVNVNRYIVGASEKTGRPGPGIGEMVHSPAASLVSSESKREAEHSRVVVNVTADKLNTEDRASTERLAKPTVAVTMPATISATIPTNAVSAPVAIPVLNTSITTLSAALPSAISTDGPASAASTVQRSSVATHDSKNVREHQRIVDAATIPSARESTLETQLKEAFEQLRRDREAFNKDKEEFRRQIVAFNGEFSKDKETLASRLKETEAHLKMVESQLLEKHTEHSQLFVRQVEILNQRFSQEKSEMQASFETLNKRLAQERSEMQENFTTVFEALNQRFSLEKAAMQTSFEEAQRSRKAQVQALTIQNQQLKTWLAISGKAKTPKDRALVETIVQRALDSGPGPGSESARARSAPVSASAWVPVPAPAPEAPVLIHAARPMSAQGAASRSASASAQADFRSRLYSSVRPSSGRCKPAKK